MNLETRLERVARLTSLLLDGRLSQAEAAELNSLLKGDPDACERYLEFVDSHACLLHLVGEIGALPIPGTKGAPPRSLPSPVSAAAPRRGWLLPLAASFVLLLAGALWFRGAAQRSDFGEVAENRLEPQNNRAWVAVVGPSADAQWGGPKARLAEGDPLAAGTLSLLSGAAQIEFFCGASIVLEGPAELEILSAWEMALLAGRLQAFVPEPAQGFTVRTPEFRAVDLGTEFILSVAGSGESEVRVVDGEVRLDNEDGDSLGLLASGEGMRVREGRLEPFTPSASAGAGFGGRELLGLAEAEWESRQQRWQASFQILGADPAALLLLDFQGHPAWARRVENRAAAALSDAPSAAPANGAVIGARWTEGRWPGKGALEFKRITDRVRLHLPGEFEALTFAARLRVEGFERWLSSLLLTDGFDEGQVHWQLSDDGELILGVQSGDGSPNTFSPPLLRPEDLGRWVHFATTVDRASGRIAHYLDGELVAEAVRSGLPPLRLGHAEIGNWSPLEGYSHPIRSLNGRIDEFLVLSRAMSAEEIQELSEAGD